MTQGGDHKTEQLSDFFLSVWSKYGHADVRLVTASAGEIDAIRVLQVLFWFIHFIARYFFHSPSLSSQQCNWSQPEEGRLIRWECYKSRSDLHFRALRLHFSHSPSLSVSCPQWGRWSRSRGLNWAGAQSQPIRGQDWEDLTNQKPGEGAWQVPWDTEYIDTRREKKEQAEFNSI